MSHTSGACEKTESSNGTMPEWVQALMPVRNLPTNNGSRIRKCIYDALEKGAPAWARRRLEFSISKQVYKANASGPTKRAILSLLADVGASVPQHCLKETRRKHVLCIPDITLKLCRNVLRLMALLVDSFCKEYQKKYPDEAVFFEEVFNYSEFRTIDCKLAVGAYGGSHELFLLDMKELWNNVRTAHGKRPNVIEFINTLSMHFQSTFEKEVLDPVRKLKVYSESNIVTEEAKREAGNILRSSSKTPKAPWNSGLCKVCNIDKDGDRVLMCDVCDGGYHTYCLAIPLGTVPEGNWYCPFCVSPENPALGCKSAAVEGAEDPETSEDQNRNIVCEMCGDIGYPEALIDCCKCKASYVHRYCSLEASQIFSEDVTWACDDCVRPLDLNQCLSPIAVEAASVSESCSDGQIEGTSSEPGRSIRRAKEKGKMKATESLTGAAGARKKGGSRVPVQPIPHPLWKGSLSTSIANSMGQVQGVLMHLSNKASPKICEELSPLPASLPVDVLPRTSIWPPRFLSAEPTAKDIDFYLLQEDQQIDGASFEAFINHVIVKDLAVRLVVEKGELLIFTCTQLPYKNWRFEGKRYLWGFFTAKQTTMAKNACQQPDA